MYSWGWARSYERSDKLQVIILSQAMQRIAGEWLSLPTHSSHLPDDTSWKVVSLSWRATFVPWKFDRGWCHHWWYARSGNPFCRVLSPYPPWDCPYDEMETHKRRYTRFTQLASKSWSWEKPRQEIDKSQRIREYGEAAQLMKSVHLTSPRLWWRSWVVRSSVLLVDKMSLRH